MTRRILCKVLFVVVVVFGLLVLSSVLLAQGHSEDAFGRVKEVQEKHTDKLMATEGVVGTAVGLDPDDRPAVKVFTEHPRVLGIPKKLDEVPVDVVVTGKFYALAKPSKPPGAKVDPAARFARPVPIGVSTGHPNITAGTIGCRVIRGSKVYALSNNHVYADESRANFRDNVLQPGPYDGGIDPDDAIGTLWSYWPIFFSANAYNTIDAAIALSSTDQLGNATPSNGYGAPKSATAAAYIGQPVQKYGRTTSLTQGKVDAINATVNVQYSRGIARFVKQIIITPGSFSAGGDSGSLVVVQQKGENDRKPVGLLFAGSQTMTVANPIDDVLRVFAVSIDGE